MPTPTNRDRLAVWFAAADKLLSDPPPLAIPPSTEPPPGTATRFTVTTGKLDTDLRILLDQLNSS